MPSWASTALVVTLVFSISDRSLTTRARWMHQLTAETLPLLAEMRRTVGRTGATSTGSTRCWVGQSHVDELG